MKSVPEPWPPWQIVQPKLLIGCGPLRVQIEARLHRLCHADRSYVAPLVKNGCDLKTRRHVLAVGVLFIAEPIDALVAGLAAVVPGNFLEVVVDQ